MRARDFNCSNGGSREVGEDSRAPKYLSRSIIIPVERDRNPQLLRQLNAAEHRALRIVRSCFTIARVDHEFDRCAITELPSYIIDWPASCKRALHTSFNTRIRANGRWASFPNLRPKRDPMVHALIVTSSLPLFNFAK